MKKVIIIFFIFVLLTGCNKNKKDDNNDIDINIENIIIENGNDKELNKDISNEEQIYENNNAIVDDYNSNNEMVDISNIKSEEDVVNYFQELKDKIKEKLDKNTWENVKESVIEALNTAYGFCFMGREIGGYTLNELNSNAKEKILNIVFEIDEFVESKSPGYKELFKESYEYLIDKSKESLEIIKDKITNIFKKEDE